MSARVARIELALGPRAASIASRAAVLSPLKLKSSPWFFIGRGSAKRSGSPVSASARELRPARIRQPEQPCDLVEGFARRVVERLADDPVAAEPGDLDELRVAARHQQREERELGRLLLEQRASRCALQVVDRDRGDLEAVRERRMRASPRPAARRSARARPCRRSRRGRQLEARGRGQDLLDHRQQLARCGRARRARARRRRTPHGSRPGSRGARRACRGPASKTATPVSSQLVSIPSTRIGALQAAPGRG